MIPKNNEDYEIVTMTSIKELNKDICQYYEYTILEYQNLEKNAKVI